MKKIMDTNKKAKIYGIIGIIFFILALVIIIISVTVVNALELEDFETFNMLRNLTGGISTILLLLGIILIILGISMYFIDRKNKNLERAPNQKALKLLYERYAKGEITEKQFDEMKKN